MSENKGMIRAMVVSCAIAAMAVTAGKAMATEGFSPSEAVAVCTELEITHTNGIDNLANFLNLREEAYISHGKYSPQYRASDNMVKGMEYSLKGITILYDYVECDKVFELYTQRM